MKLRPSTKTQPPISNRLKTIDWNRKKAHGAKPRTLRILLLQEVLDRFLPHRMNTYTRLAVFDWMPVLFRHVKPVHAVSEPRPDFGRMNREAEVRHGVGSFMQQALRVIGKHV